MKTRIAASLILMLGLCVCVAAQEKAQDRRKFLDPSTPVSDDPRRIPVKPGPQGPERVLVLRGGRIFDGTGAAAHEGTLVIEHNKISKILPASSTDWPKSAEVVDASGKTILPGLIDLHTHLTYPLTEEMLCTRRVKPTQHFALWKSSATFWRAASPVCATSVHKAM